MTVIMGQMALLAQPLKLALGDSYDENKLNEELIVVAPGIRSWVELKIICPTATASKKLGQDLYSLQVPTFKGLTVALKELSTHPEITLSTISNNVEVQVRVMIVVEDDSIESKDRLDRLLREIDVLQGCHLKFKYNYPFNPNEVMASVEVSTPHLLEFIRFCDASKINVAQIYDFF